MNRQYNALAFLVDFTKRLRESGGRAKWIGFVVRHG
jgi:hypothetical protein